MNLQSLVEKCKQYPFASVSAAVTLVLLFAIYFRGMGEADQRARYDEAVKNWAQIEENVFRNSINLEAHLENAKAVTADIKERLIRPSELAKNYQYFYRMEAATGVKITTLQQETPKPPPAAKKDDKEDKKPKPLFSNIGYTMSVTGSFHQMLAFLHGIEHGQHFYRLKDFSVQRAMPAEGRNIAITMNFELLGTP